MFLCLATAKVHFLHNNLSPTWSFKSSSSVPITTIIESIHTQSQSSTTGVPISWATLWYWSCGPLWTGPGSGRQVGEHMKLHLHKQWMHMLSYHLHRTITSHPPPSLLVCRAKRDISELPQGHLRFTSGATQLLFLLGISFVIFNQKTLSYPWIHHSRTESPEIGLSNLPSFMGKAGCQLPHLRKTIKYHIYIFNY